MHRESVVVAIIWLVVFLLSESELVFNLILFMKSMELLVMAAVAAVEVLVAMAAAAAAAVASDSLPVRWQSSCPEVKT